MGRFIIFARPSPPVFRDEMMFALVNDNTDTVSLCGLSWEDVFILNGVLLRAKDDIKIDYIKDHINEIVEHCEAAEERIFEDY